MIKHNLIQKACEIIIETRSNKEEIIIWELLKNFGSSNIEIELLKLAENYNDSVETNPPNRENLEDKISNLNIKCANEMKNFEGIISDKIIESDLEGAMNDCLNACRNVDALIIANCGGIELRSKAESFILKNNNSFHLNIAIHMSRNDFLGFVSTAPLSEWIRIIKGIFKFSVPESLSQLSKVLSKRLMNESMYYPALFATLLAQDFESFFEIVFNLTLGDRNPNISELIYLFKIIRIIEIFKPDSIKNFENYSTRLKVFEIISKLASLFLSAGLSAKFIINFLDKDFYDNHIKYINPEVEAFLGYTRLAHSDSINLHSDLTKNLSNGIKHQSSKEIVPNYVTPGPVLIHQKVTPSPPLANVNYNDAPIINPKLSKFSPQICNQGPQYFATLSH